MWQDTKLLFFSLGYEVWRHKSEIDLKMPEVGLVKVASSLDKHPTPCFFALVRTDLDVFPTKRLDHLEIQISIGKMPMNFLTSHRHGKPTTSGVFRRPWARHCGLADVGSGSALSNIFNQGLKILQLAR